MLEDEEYYDSIDDSEFESCRSFCNPNFQETDPELEEEDTKLDELVPFYGGNVEKSEIESIRTESKSNSCVSLRNKLKKKRNVLPNMGSRKNRSYLTMFYEKSGLQAKTDISTTNKSTSVNMSPKSCFSYRTGRDRDPEMTNSNRFKSSYNNQTNISLLQSDYDKSLSASTLDTKAPSEFYIESLELKNHLETKKGSKRRNKPVKVTELGGLGPNIVQDKLELLRKRQNYGRIVSEKNRIKILENKVVQKLNQEIRESNRV
ncbi:uncharacterized protein LOC143191577 [Rhynchophorus ferrugineus]|uniref:Uncharacterized protein n=1 Tax=Rhynchophorus ferrugineus TaxID=354439 RepID=A0A834HQM6_RHYFE|nr:hypothetical protein GWI33_019815 [Rhynchophorus ferrugineus]